jgi:iron complex outermembrane receptor protein
MKTTTPSRSAAARRFVPVAAIMLATTLNITAAEAKKTAPVAADPHLVELPELVVTARRVEEHPLDVPAYTNVITREQIEKSGASNLIELLKSQANLSFTSLSSGPTNTKVSMRGTGTDGNGRTLILIDGIRANRPDMGEFNWLQFAVQDIESIEVIQGPQGGYYGDNAVGGVIKINTRGTPTKSGGQVNALVGSNATIKTSGLYTQALGKAWVSVSGGHDESDGYRARSGYDADSAALKIGYDNNKKSLTQMGFAYVDTDYEQPGGLTLDEYNSDPTQLGTHSVADGRSEVYRMTVSNEYGEKSGSKLITDAGYFSTKEFSHTQYFQFGGFESSFDRVIEGGSFSPKALIVLGGGRITPGLDVNYDEIDSKASGTFTNPAWYGDISRTVVAPYMGGEYALSDVIGVSGVVRHEFNEMSAERVNATRVKTERNEEGSAYQLAVNCRPVKSVRYYAKYDHSYRFPATDEIAYYQGLNGGPGGTPVFFNQDLKPEVSDAFEAGGDYTDGFWVLGGAVYHMETEDEIAYNSSTNLNENIARTERSGVQAHVVHDRCWVGFRTRADYVSARIKENSGASSQQSGQLPMVPVWQSTSTVFVRPLTGLLIEFTHRFLGSSNSTFSTTPANMIELPAANMFDFKVSYQLTPAWLAYLGANNIADQKSMGAAFQTDFGANTIYPNEGRFIYLGSTYKF